MVVITDIYAASETPINGVSGETVVDSVRRRGHRSVMYVKDWRAGVLEIVHRAKPGDLVLTLGAGDVDQAPAILSEELGKHHGQ